MSATNRGAVRNERDFYATPLSAFTPLLPYLRKDCMTWEPACGDSRLVLAMRDAGIHAWGSDIEPQNPDGGNKLDFLCLELDFLSLDPGVESSAGAIVTNPPFSLAFEFCQQARKLSDETFLLLPLNFLASKRRRDWFRENEPCAIFVLSHRPSFTGKGTDACDYGWMHWSNNPRHRGIIHL